jgi:hypothetical protein
MDTNFFQSLDGPVDKAGAEFDGYIQVLNISGSIVQVVDGWYLRANKCAFVHPDNQKVQKLLKLRRIKSMPFKPKKKSKSKNIIEAPSQSVKETNELQTLENMFLKPLVTESNGETFAK